MPCDIGVFHLAGMAKVELRGCLKSLRGCMKRCPCENGAVLISEDLERSRRPPKGLYISRKRSFLNFSHSLSGRFHLGLVMRMIGKCMPDNQQAVLSCGD